MMITFPMAAIVLISLSAAIYGFVLFVLIRAMIRDHQGGGSKGREGEQLPSDDRRGLRPRPPEP